MANRHLPARFRLPRSRGNIIEHIPGCYSSADGGNKTKTTQTITDTRAGESFTNDGVGADDPDGRHLCNLPIRTEPGVRDEHIQQEGTLEFGTMTFNGRPDSTKSRNLAEALFAEMQSRGVPGAMLSEDHLTITYDRGDGKP